MNGALASLNSVAKIPYRNVCQDGVSNTFSIVPNALGKTDCDRTNNLVSILDGYFVQGAHHLNVNVLNRQLLQVPWNIRKSIRHLQSEYQDMQLTSADLAKSSS